MASVFNEPFVRCNWMKSLEKFSDFIRKIVSIHLITLVDCGLLPGAGKIRSFGI